MKRINLINSLAMAILLCPFCYAQDAAKEKPQAPSYSQDDVFKAPKPTKRHKVIFEDLGTWDCDISMNLGPETMKLKGVETNHRMGAFWKISNFSYEVNGQKMRGHGQFGYDKTKDKYTGTWLDSLSTDMSIMEGDYDEATKTMTLNMTSKDPDGNEVQMRVVTVQPDKTNKTFTMQMLSPGSEDQYVTIMEMKCKKRATEKKQP